jgi:hypothetical protein
VIIIFGGLTVLGGSCCAFSAVAQALNEAGGVDVGEE